jgi:hypothetical protein
MIRLPRNEVEGPTRNRFGTEASEASYTRPRPGIDPAGVAFADSWGMSQHLNAMGHLTTQNGQIVVVIEAQ